MPCRCPVGGQRSCGDQAGFAPLSEGGRPIGPGGGPGTGSALAPVAVALSSALATPCGSTLLTAAPL